MKVTAILGMDVSKNTLDCYLHQQQQELSAVTNNLKGFKRISRWVFKNLKSTEGLLVVMEYTGIYTYGIERYLYEQGICFVKRPALDIKRSLGIVRGKSDKADARFIGKYGWLRRDELQAMKPLSDIQLELQQLMSHRDKLVSDRASYKSKLKELTCQMSVKLNTKMIESMEWIIDVFSTEIRATEKSIETLLQSEHSLKTNYDLCRTVVGIGFASAVHLIIATENFTRFSEARKLICYCGSAPFEHSSGTSIRGKTKVSHLANKKLKSLLTMAAISAIKSDMALKSKYEQKLKEGKAKMCVINIIRAKLIERVFAVIKRQSAYEIRWAA